MAVVYKVKSTQFVGNSGEKSVTVEASESGVVITATYLSSMLFKGTINEIKVWVKNDMKARLDDAKTRKTVEDTFDGLVGSEI